MNLIASTVQAAIGCRAGLAAMYAPLLSEACVRFNITTTKRLAGFLAQIGHESGSLVYSTELWGPTEQQLRYEGRADLGNVQAGDGPLFKGHGLIQITGRGNHRAATVRLRRALPNEDVPDFEVNPAALGEPRWAALSAAEFWEAHGCNELADEGDIIGLGRLINRGNAKSEHPANGEDDRIARYRRALAALPELEAPEFPTTVDPAPAAWPEVRTDPVPEPAPPPAPQPEPSMGASFLWGLASTVFNLFQPLVSQKISAEVARHVDNPEIAQQIATNLVDKAKELTGLADPMEAIVAVKKDPAMVKQLEDHTLENLDKLAPVLDKLAQWDQQAWAASEASAAAAAQRAQGDPNDQDAYLTRSVVRLVVGILIGGAVLTAVLAYLKTDVQVILGALLALVGSIGGKFQTRYDHRYGSSRSSSAKDVTIAELNRRPKP